MTVATWLLKQVPGPVPGLPVAGPADCTSVWTFRGVMLLRMQQEGVKKLKVDNIGLRTFCRMNPDEDEHMLRVFAANRATQLSHLATRNDRHSVDAVLSKRWESNRCRRRSLLWRGHLSHVPSHQYLKSGPLAQDCHWLRFSADGWRSTS